MKQDECQKVINLIQEALNENVGHRINEYTGTGILTVLARQIGELVNDDKDSE
jgi:hypothetical protein